MKRRKFIKQVAVGSTLSMLPLSWVWGKDKQGLLSAQSAGPTDRDKPLIHCAFTYPPTSRLEEEGYFSYPGSSFDAEERQKRYERKLRGMEQKLGVDIDFEGDPLDESESVTRFINKVKNTNPNGLVLFPFKKSHWDRVMRIVEETQTPAVVLATQGVLLIGHVRQLYEESGAYMINSLNNLDAVEYGLRMIRTAFRMSRKTILNIDYSERSERRVPVIGTRVVTVPIDRFYELYDETDVTSEVQHCADDWWNNAEKAVHQQKSGVVKGARAYYALKKFIKEEQADAMMMNCLPGVRSREHVPPCMGYMALRDQGIPAGCESDTDSTLCMMLLQELFNKPAFQHNEMVDTEKNTYFAAHCTSASKMKGFGNESEPYEMWDHAEAGWGCVPRVLMEPGTPVTVTYYHAAGSEGERPKMAIYSGEVLRPMPLPETGGCRTNVEVKLHDIDDVVNFKAGRHTSLIYGNHKEDLQHFCQLMDIEELRFESA